MIQIEAGSELTEDKHKKLGNLLKTVFAWTNQWIMFSIYPPPILNRARRAMNRVGETKTFRRSVEDKTVIWTSLGCSFLSLNCTGDCSAPHLTLKSRAGFMHSSFPSQHATELIKHLFCAFSWTAEMYIWCVCVLTSLKSTVCEQRKEQREFSSCCELLTRLARS